MARDERPVQLPLPWFAAAYGVLGLVGIVLAPWRGTDSRAMTAIVVTMFVLTLVWWKLQGPVAESRPLTPLGRAFLPPLMLAGWVGIAAVIVVP